MVHWVQTMPQPEINGSEYRPFIRNVWFRKRYMVFAYGLMALLTLLLLITGGMNGVSLFLRLPLILPVFLLHELLHILVVYRTGEIYMTRRGLYFWLQPEAKLSKGRFWLFMSLPLLTLTVIPAACLLLDTGALRPYLRYIAWVNAIIAGSDIINSLLILPKPRDAIFYWGHYKTGFGQAAEPVTAEPSSSHTTVIFVRHAQAVYGSDDRARPLTGDGLEDRKIVAETLRDRKIDAFLSSPYRRSMDTIRPAAELRGMEIRTDERLRERKCGDFTSGSLEKRWADFTWAEENGENLGSVQARNMEALREILRDYAGRTVVVGTHGTALSTILNFYRPDFGLQDFLRIVNRMPCIIEMTFTGDKLIGISELAHVEKEIPQ